MTASNPHTRHDRTGQPPEQGHTTTNSSNNSNSFYNFKKSKLFSLFSLLLPDARLESPSPPSTPRRPCARGCGRVRLGHAKLFSPPALPAARTLHVGFVSEV